jgi:hypothetical protein
MEEDKFVPGGEATERAGRLRTRAQATAIGRWCRRIQWSRKGLGTIGRGQNQAAYVIGKTPQSGVVMG